MAKSKLSDIKYTDRQIRVTGIGKTLHTDIKNIAHNIGTSMTDYVKMKLHDAVCAEPDHYKKPMNND